MMNLRCGQRGWTVSGRLPWRGVWVFCTKRVGHKGEHEYFDLEHRWRMVAV